MDVNLVGGKIRLQDLGSKGYLAVIHGGAGPADPKGPQAKSAAEAIAGIARQLHGEVIPEIAPQIRPSAATATFAERFALAAVKELEAHPRFNAGFGAALQSDGVPRVSASFMESTREKFSAVMNGEEILHPSELAFYLQGERFTVLDGQGTARLARQLRIPCTDLVTPARFDRWLTLRRESLPGQTPASDGKGTVGCTVVDALGNLAAATSTGGVGNETVGRVGDSPTVAGNFCTKKVAISCTGYGEQILATAFAARVATRLDDGATLRDAMTRSFGEALQRGFEFAAIAVSFDPESGTVEWLTGTTEPFFIWASLQETGIRIFDDTLV